MENKSKTLEKKTDKLDWKQWLPVYGIAQNIRDAYLGKPNMILTKTEKWGVQPTKSAVFIGCGIYHSIAMIGTAYGLHQLAEKLF